MRNIAQYLLSAAICLAAHATIAATDYGFCSDAVVRTNLFRVGESETQGVAIRLSAEKLAMLQGHNITGVKLAVGSSRTTDGTISLFISRDLNAEPVVTHSVSLSSAAKWIEFDFDSPFAITTDTPDLYIGYTGSIATTGKLLLADFAGETPASAFVYNDGSWQDMYGMGYGMPMLRIITDCPNPTTDIIIRPIDADGFFKVGSTYTLSADLYNFGPQTINSLDITVDVGDSHSIHTIGNLQIAQNQSISVNLPDINVDSPGMLPLSVYVSNINGGDDLATADNSFEADMFFYPADIERSILIESFTGQDCSNCPAGHNTIHNFLADHTSTPVIEINHHSGYGPDQMSMDADYDFTYFYGSPSTYAPAIMVNRMVVPTLGNVPVYNVTAQNLSAAFAHAEHSQPYLSLALNTSFDPESRRLDISVDSYAHRDLPSDVNIINVMLVQDSIIARQTPYGDTYVHNAANRGVLTGNSWGITLPNEATKAGGSASWSVSYTVPEAIFSDYWAASYTESDPMRIFYTIPVVTENMKVVAYAAAFSPDNLAGHTVYNAVSTKLGDSYTQGGFTGIIDIDAEVMSAPVISVIGRRLSVSGEYDSLSVHGLDGRSVEASAALVPGVYIVRAAKGQNVSVKKIIIR